MDSAGERFEAIRAALADRNNILTVKDLCELAGVSRSGYYNWVRSEKNREFREAKDRAAFEQILEAYRFRGYAKGVRGIHMRLLHMGIRMNVKKIRRLMRKYKLTCPIRKPNPYRRLQRSIRMGSAAENLVNREFESHGPRAILLTDITYIPLRGRFCYLSTILDACTKQVLAYAMSESLEVDFVLETVQLLVKHHGISLSKETVIHSDQGTHYTSLKFIQLVENSALRRSMSRRGNCWDNAPQESFFGHMKDELASEIPGWTSFEAVKASIDRWMDYYTDILKTDNHGSISLVNRETGERIDGDGSTAFFDSARTGSYEDYIFTGIEADALGTYALYGEFVTSHGSVEGNWSVTFPLENTEGS